MNTHLLAPRDVDQLAARILAAPRVAVDTEFHAENRWLPQLHLVQIAIPGGDAWIVDPMVPGLVQGLADALRATPWVVHGGEQDLRILERALGGVPVDVRDTQIEAGLVGTAYPATFAQLVKRWVGVDVDKSATLSDWSQRPLTQAQLTYAAADVLLLLPLAERLEAALAERGRTASARAACAEAVTLALEPRDEDAFRELAAASLLEGVHVALLQALAAWREATARASDQPPRAVLSDGVLLDLARRAPTTAGAVTANRTVTRRVTRHAEELAHVVQRVLAAPPETWPRSVHRHSPAARASAWLQLWAQVAGDAGAWAQGLVLPRDLADRIVLADPSDRAGLTGWRGAVLGEDLSLALDGHVSLRMVAEGLVAHRS